MNKFYAIGIGILIAIGIYYGGVHNGKLSIANDLIKLEAKRAEQVTALTLEVVGKQKIINAQKRKTLEVIRHAKVDSCADSPLPAVFVGILR